MPNQTFIDKIINLNQPYTFTYNQINSLFQDKTATIIYIPEAPHTGKEFVNRFRKKGVFNEILIPQFFIMNGRKLNMMTYIKEFKSVNPNVKVVYKFKSFIKNKINLIDLTGLVELFYITMKYKSKFKALADLFNYSKELLKDNNIHDDIYIFYEGSSTNNIIIENLGRLAIRRGMKLDSDFMTCNALLGFLNLENQFKLYPLFIKVNENNNTYYQFKFPIFKMYSTEAFNEKIIEDDEEKNSLDDLRNEILDLSNKILQNKKTISEKIEKELEKETGISDLLNSENQLIDTIYNKVLQLNPNDTFENNLKDLMKELPDKDRKIINELINYINEINEKYNGVIKLDKKLIEETSDLYYNPLDVIKLDKLNIYNKHATEFDTILDNAMFDLIKSIEKDKDAGLKVEKIDSEIIDDNKSRYKEYRVKIKPDNDKSYTISFRVPYPIKDKYMKLDGNTYIMINQFFPKPIMKIKPNIVRFYTHYSTLTCTLKNHKINEMQGLEGIIREVASLTKAKIEFNNEEINKIKNEFDIQNIPLVKVEFS